MAITLIRRCVWVCLVLWLLVGCNSSYADPATVASGLEPAAIFGKLSNNATISEAAAQFATALNIDPAAVRVRLQPGNCMVCTFESRPQLSKVEGLSVDEASKIAKPNDKVTLFVPKFSCIFELTATTVLPRSCQPSPI